MASKPKKSKPRATRARGPNVRLASGIALTRLAELEEACGQNEHNLHGHTERLAVIESGNLRNRMDRAEHQSSDAFLRIQALEEAICPRVAARLTALERWTAKRTLAEDISRDAQLRGDTPYARFQRAVVERSTDQCSMPGRTVGKLPELGAAYAPGHPVSSFERLQRYKKVQQIAREVLGDNHSFKGTYGDIEVIVRRK